MGRGRKRNTTAFSFLMTTSRRISPRGVSAQYAPDTNQQRIDGNMPDARDLRLHQVRRDINGSISSGKDALSGTTVRTQPPSGLDTRTSPSADFRRAFPGSAATINAPAPVSEPGQAIARRGGPGTGSGPGQNGLNGPDGRNGQTAPAGATGQPGAGPNPPGQPAPNGQAAPVTPAAGLAPATNPPNLPNPPNPTGQPAPNGQAGADWRGKSGPVDRMGDRFGDAWHNLDPGAHGFADENAMGLAATAAGLPNALALQRSNLLRGNRGQMPIAPEGTGPDTSAPTDATVTAFAGGGKVIASRYGTGSNDSRLMADNSAVAMNASAVAARAPAPQSTAKAVQPRNGPVSSASTPTDEEGA